MASARADDPRSTLARWFAAYTPAEEVDLTAKHNPASAQTEIEARLSICSRAAFEKLLEKKREAFGKLREKERKVECLTTHSELQTLDLFYPKGVRGSVHGDLCRMRHAGGCPKGLTWCLAIPTYTRKTRVGYMDVGRVRYTLSREMPVPESAVVHTPTYSREKNRWSFVNKGTFSYDLTHAVDSDGKHRYEAEIEWIPSDEPVKDPVRLAKRFVHRVNELRDRIEDLEKRYG